MSTRTVSVLMLFAVALLIGMVGTAMVVAIAQSMQIALSAWTMPAMLFVSAVAVFFLGRHYVLPRHLAVPATRALVVVITWIGLTMGVTWGAIFAIRLTPAAALLSGFGVTVPWLLVLLASHTLFAKRNGALS